MWGFVLYLQGYWKDYTIVLPLSVIYNNWNLISSWEVTLNYAISLRLKKYALIVFLILLREWDLNNAEFYRYPLYVHVHKVNFLSQGWHRHKKANYNFMNRKYKIWGFDFLYCCTLNNSTISREYLHPFWHRTSRNFH